MEKFKNKIVQIIIDLQQLSICQNFRLVLYGRKFLHLLFFSLKISLPCFAIYSEQLVAFHVGRLLVNKSHLIAPHCSQNGFFVVLQHCSYIFWHITKDISEPKLIINLEPSQRKERRQFSFPNNIKVLLEGTLFDG